jgi:MFS superfamily sulfate permease-like transporter
MHMFGLESGTHMYMWSLPVYLSDQIIRGFTTGSAVLVLTSQLNKVLNVRLARYDGVGSLFYVGLWAHVDCNCPADLS